MTELFPGSKTENFSWSLCQDCDRRTARTLHETLAWILLVVSRVATFRGFSLQLSFQPSDLCSVAPGKEQSVGDSVQIMPTGFWTYNSQFRSSRAGLGQADWRRDRAALVMCPIWDLPLVAYRVN